jgi:hypothetical protein
MKNPFGDQQVPGSYVNLKERMVKKVKATDIEQQVRMLFEKAYENALDAEHIVLSRPERIRLFKQVTKLVLDDIAKKFDGPSRSS